MPYLPQPEPSYHPSVFANRILYYTILYYIYHPNVFHGKMLHVGDRWPVTHSTWHVTLIYMFILVLWVLYADIKRFNVFCMRIFGLWTILKETTLDKIQPLLYLQFKWSITSDFLPVCSLYVCHNQGPPPPPSPL